MTKANKAGSKKDGARAGVPPPKPIGAETKKLDTTSKAPPSSSPAGKAPVPSPAQTRTQSPSQQGSAAPQSQATAGENKGKQGGKNNNRPRIGGTAVQGAKSTQPREVKSTSPQDQEKESYNRVMRRRMEHIGAGTAGSNDLQEQRQKRVARRKKRIEERKQEVKKTIAGGPRKITLGRRNTYFLIAVAVILVAIIAFAIIRNYFFR